MRADWRKFWFFRRRAARSGVSTRLPSRRVHSPSPAACAAGSVSHGPSSPSERDAFRTRSTTVPMPRGLETEGEPPSLRFGVPLRDVSQQRPHGARRTHPPRFVPSSAFRTPSTVFSAAGLAGLFHPAATSRVVPSGVCPSFGAAPGSPGRCPRVVEAPSPAVARAGLNALDFRALLSERVRKRPETGESTRRLAPLVELTSSG